MQVREIKYINHGICVDQPCPIFSNENAILVMGKSYFQPSWQAQKQGYKIIKADTWIRKKIIKWFFADEFKIGNN